MRYKEEIEAFCPQNEQEKKDRQVILDFIRVYGDQTLMRSCETAHLTSSAFIVNQTFDKALMVYHTLRDVWSWTGGHADGEENLELVARKEAEEETGITELSLLSDGIGSIDILVMPGHIRKGEYVNTHLHLSIAYLYIADETKPLRIAPDENKAVQWMNAEEFTDKYFAEDDVYLYNKLMRYARECRR